MDVRDYSANKILMISNPGDLFTGPTEFHSEYRDLVKFWHPDVSDDPSASDVIKKLNELYKSAKDMASRGTWSKTGRVRIPANKPIDINYIFDYDFPFGHTYICRNSLIYHFYGKYLKFADRYEKAVKGLRYADSSMKDRMRYFVPEIYNTIDVSDGRLILINKNSRLIRLRDVLSSYNGKLPHRHMAWIVSSLLNIVCFINYNGITNNGIDLDSYYIDPTDHNGTLYGGWWFTVEESSPLVGVSREVFEVMPARAKAEKIGRIQTDLEAIKLIGRQLIDDKYGMNIKGRDKDIPECIIEFLNSLSHDTAYDEYSSWSRALDTGYGKREFVNMDIRAEDIYSF